MSTGYYRPEMTPPGYEGRWPHRLVERDEHGQQTERMVQSPFLPARIGNPSGDVPAFRDFQDHASRNRKAEHPDWYCQGCGIRYAVAICPACKSGRTVMLGTVPAVEVMHRCASCERRFLGLLLCGPCIGEREAPGQLRTPARATSTATRAHPMRRQSAGGGARR